MAVKVKMVRSDSYAPSAQCQGVDKETPCSENWETGSSHTSRADAKEHAQKFPGHYVVVATETVDFYLGQEN